MKFKQIRDEYYAQTAKASDVMRQLAYAGFAVLWIFKQSTGLPVPPTLLPAATLFAVALLCDVLQYLFLAAAWSKIAIAADAATESEEDDYEVPLQSNNWGIRFYNVKAYALASGYGYLVFALTWMFLAS